MTSMVMKSKCTISQKETGWAYLGGFGAPAPGVTKGMPKKEEKGKEKKREKEGKKGKGGQKKRKNKEVSQHD